MTMFPPGQPVPSTVAVGPAGTATAAGAPGAAGGGGKPAPATGAAGGAGGPVGGAGPQEGHQEPLMALTSTFFPSLGLYATVEIKF